MPDRLAKMNKNGFRPETTSFWNNLFCTRKKNDVGDEKCGNPIRPKSNESYFTFFFFRFSRINYANLNNKINLMSAVALFLSLSLSLFLHTIVARVFRTDNKNKTKSFIDFIYMRSADISFEYVYSLLLAAVGSSIFLFRSRLLYSPYSLWCCCCYMPRHYMAFVLANFTSLILII